MLWKLLERLAVAIMRRRYGHVLCCYGREHLAPHVVAFGPQDALNELGHAYIARKMYRTSQVAH